MTQKQITLALDPTTDTTGNAEQVARMIGCSAWHISGDFLVIENPLLGYKVTDNETYSSLNETTIPDGATIILLDEEQNSQVELKAGDEVTEQKLKEQSTAPRVTNTDIDALMQRVVVHTTTCQEPTPHVMAIAWLDGKFHLGTAISKSDIQTGYFNEELGIKYSTKDVLAIAENKLCELEGYSLYQKLHIKQQWQAEYEREQNNQAGLKVGIDHGVEN